MGEEKKKKRKWFMYVFLTLMLAVLPAMSWYYLKNGLDYQLEIRNELKDLGEMPVPAANQINRLDSLQNQVFDKKMVVVGIGAKNDLPLEETKFIYEQFSERKDIVFLTISNDDSACLDFRNSNSLDPLQWTVIGAEKPYSDIYEEYSFPSQNPEQFLALVDTNLVVRSHYQVTEEARRNRLIETLAVLMPKDEEREIKYRAETEK